MKHYSSYKDSGIAWIGQIPSHWDVSRVASLYTENTSKNTDNEFALAMRFNYGTLVDKNEAGDVSDLKETYSAYTKVKKNDVVINGLNLNYDFNSLRVAISPKDGIITSAYIIMTPRPGTNSTYYNYLFKSMDSRKIFHGMGTGIRLTLSFAELKKQALIVPPADEQEAIVRFITEKSEKIDRYIAEQERLLAALDELRAAEIARAVTRGLNPDVPLRDSGIDWIGQIPAEWKVRKMKFSFSQRSDKNHPNETKLSATQSHGVIPQSMYEDKGNHVVDVNRNFEGLKLVKVGDFVIHLRSFQGGLAYAYYQGIISAAYTVLTPIEKDFTDYYRYLFISYPYIQLLKTCVTGIREGQNIDYGVLGNKYIPIPPLSEQRAIVEYLDEKTAKIDRMKADIEKQIGLLKEYKQRMISDAVTGKIDVRE